MPEYSSFNAIRDILKKGRREEITWSMFVFLWNRFCMIYTAILYAIKINMSLNKSSKIYKINNFQMALDPRSKGIDQELIIHGNREPFSTSFFSLQIKPDDVVLDIGSNIGYYAILESKKVLKGKIHAVEPVPDTIIRLKENLRLNGSGNVIVHEVAFGSAREERKFFIHERCNWSSFNEDMQGRIIKEIDVHVIPIDDFIKQNNIVPNWIRMDIEGFEYEVLKGAIDLLSSPSPICLFIEIHPHLLSQEDLASMIRLLKSTGFKVSSIFREPPIFLHDALWLTNLLYEKAGIMNYGFFGNDYEDLEYALKEKRGIEVFLAKI